MAAAERTIHLVDAQGGKHPLSEKAITFARYLRDFFQQQPDATEVELPRVEPEEVDLAIRYLQLRSAKPQGKVCMPLQPRTEKTSLEANGLEKDFGDFIRAVPMKQLFKLYSAADFLKIEGLLNLCAMQLAWFYLGLSPVEKQAILLNCSMDSIGQEEEDELNGAYPWLCKEEAKDDSEGVEDVAAATATAKQLEARAGGAAAAAGGAGAEGGK